MTTYIIGIPQRLQLLNDYSATKSGAALLPLMITTSVFAILSSIAVPAWGLHAFWSMMSGSLLQTLGCGLLTLFWRMSDTKLIYVALAIMGAGFGLSMNSVTLMAANSLSRAELGTLDYHLPLWSLVLTILSTAGSAITALTQVRLMGGTVGIAST